MKSKKITSLFFLTVSPLMIFIALLNELRFFLTAWINTHIFPWSHLLQSGGVIIGGFILLMLPALFYANRLDHCIRDENKLSDELKSITFVKSTRAISVLTALSAFVLIVLPSVTGLFFTEMKTVYEFPVSRTVLDLFVSLILCVMSTFLGLFFFQAEIEKHPEISSLKKLSSFYTRKNFSFGSVMFFGIFQALILTTGLFLSLGALFAEKAVTNPQENDLMILLIAAAGSVIPVSVFMILYFRVFKSLQERKIARTAILLDEISLSKHHLKGTNILTLDEFDDLYETLGMLVETARSVSAEFKEKTTALQNSLRKTEKFRQQSERPLLQMVKLSNDTTEANTQINSMAHSDRNVHNLTEIVRKMEAQIISQEESVEKTSTAIGQMTSSIAVIIQTIQTASRLAEKLKNYSTTGNSAIDEAKKAIEEIREAAQSVSEILSVIQRIAAQTNLLSMNASIEAAHAGNSGTGFALVAQSVRSLADASMKSAKKIESHIGEMSEWIQSAIQTIQATTKIFVSIQKNIGENAELIETISNAMNEEEGAAQDTVTAISSVVASVKNIKAQFQTQKEASINVEETITLILDISDRMQQLLHSENEMTTHLKNLMESMKKALTQSDCTLMKIESAANMSSVS